MKKTIFVISLALVVVFVMSAATVWLTGLTLTSDKATGYIRSAY
jgi:hypothetical protein